MEAALSGMEHFDILQAGRKVAADRKRGNLADRLMVANRFDRILVGWDSDDHLEDGAAHS
jgi:hypothetical protein